MLALDERDGRVVLTLAERVRVPALDELHQLARAAADRGTDVDVELGASEHLHAGAVQILSALVRAVAARARRVRIVAASAEAREALVLAGLPTWCEEP